MRHALCLLAAALAAISATADTVRVKAPDRQTLVYQDTEILSGDVTGVSLRYSSRSWMNFLNETIRTDKSGGVVGVQFSEMLPEDRDKYGAEYGYDPVKAAKAEKARAKAMAKHLRQKRAEEEENRELTQRSYAQSARRDEVAKTLRKQDYVKSVKVTILQAMDDGAVAVASSVDGGTEIYKKHPNFSRNIYIVGLGTNDGKADGDTWKGALYECGVMSGSTVDGAATSLHRYATSKERALELLEGGSLPPGN